MSQHAKLDTAAFRRQLIARADELESVAETSAEAARPVELDQAKVGRVSRMDAIRSQAMSVETERRCASELGRIRAALNRIDDDAYGDCLHCAEPIAIERLAVDPAAPLCIDCASKAEDADRQR